MVNTRSTKYPTRVTPNSIKKQENEEKEEEAYYKSAEFKRIQKKKNKNPIMPRQPNGPTLLKKKINRSFYTPNDQPKKEFIPTTRSAENYLFFCRSLEQISPKVKRPEKTKSKKMPPIDDDDGGVPIPFLETYIANFINIRRKESERVPTQDKCQGCLLGDESNCRGLYPIRIPKYIKDYLKDEDGLEWKIMDQVPFIWFVCWMEREEPNTEKEGWEKYVIKRTCDNTKCTNGFHMKWAPADGKLFYENKTNDPGNYYEGPPKPFPMPMGW